MTIQSDWRTRLDQAVRTCKADVIGHSHIRHFNHAVVVMTALQAFGDDPRVHFFIEGLAPQSDIPRPDLILLHPDLGIVIIENKGISLQDIHGVRGTMLSVIRDGRIKEEDPFIQADHVMYGLRDLMRPWLPLSEVLFNRTATLPRIERAQFSRKFNVKWPLETMFAEDCTDPKRFRQQLVDLSDRSFRGLNRSTRLSAKACRTALDILNGSRLFSTPRRTLVDSTDRNLLGVQIQELELGLKKPTQQQMELGRTDLRGKHRLFRGVAGSGKSIMLAMSVAYSLVRYRDESHSLFESNPAVRRILVVCFNRALVQYLRQKIEDRYGSITFDAVPEDAVTITHFEGLIRRLENELPFLKTGLTYRESEERARRMKRAIESLSESDLKKIQFDAIYIDEAQDLDPLEIELLLTLAKKELGGQTVIVFYDNAQNIFGVTTPVWQKHGVEIVGRTEYLDICLRNTRQTLEMAFNVLVGSFAPENERVMTREFADLASLRQRKLVEENGDRIEVNFAPRTGLHPHVQTFESGEAEVNWAVSEIVSERPKPATWERLKTSHLQGVNSVVGYPVLELEPFDDESTERGEHAIHFDAVFPRLFVPPDRPRPWIGPGDGA